MATIPKKMFKRCVVKWQTPNKLCPRRQSTSPGVPQSLPTLQDIPKPRGLPIIGTTLPLIFAGSTARLHEYIDKRHRQLGPVFRDSVGPVQAVFLSRPEAIRAVFTPTVEGRLPRHILPDAWVLYNELYGCQRGLFFMDGEEWWHYRRIMNKILLKVDLAWLEAPLQTCTGALTTRWWALIDHKGSVEIKNLESDLYRLSIDVMVATLLGHAYKSNAPRLEQTVTEFADVVHKVFLYSSKLAIIPVKLSAKFKTPAWNGFVIAAESSLRLAKTLVDQILDECTQGDGLMAKMQEEGIDRKYITRIVADLIIAAGDTTAFTTQWLLYLLAKNPEKQASLRKAVQSKEDTTLCKGAIKEALRLYPVAPFLTRILSEDAEVAGYSVPKNTVIVMSLYTCGRDPTNFTNPLEFLPERWSHGPTCPLMVHKAHGTVPFALGARSCIGQKIANKQILMTMTKVLEHFSMDLLNKGNVDMAMRMVAVPSVPVRLKITKI